MQAEFEKSGISQDSRVKSADREATAKVISQMLAEDSLAKHDFLLAFPNEGFAKGLFHGNTFSLDIATRRATFQSTAMRNSCKEHPEVWRVGG